MDLPRRPEQPGEATIMRLELDDPGVRRERVHGRPPVTVSIACGGSAVTQPGESDCERLEVLEPGLDSGIREPERP